jgi:hypothetical protein
LSPKSLPALTLRQAGPEGDLLTFRLLKKSLKGKEGEKNHQQYQEQ